MNVTNSSNHINQFSVGLLNRWAWEVLQQNNKKSPCLWSYDDINIIEGNHDEA